MTDRKEHNRNPRMIRPKPIKLERSRESNVEKQCQFKARKHVFKETTNVHVRAHESLKDVVTNQKVRKVAHDIVQYIINALHVLPGVLSKKNVVKKVMANLKALDFIPKSTSKQASLIVVWNEIISGLKESLGAMKNLYTFAKLATKHALLIAAISFVDKSSLLRQKACI